MIPNSSICTLLMIANIFLGNYKIPKYDIEEIKTGKEETVLVTVYVYGNNISEQYYKLAAVHGVVFRGYNGDQRHPAQPPMSSDDQAEKNERFCSEFFDINGQYQDFANVIIGSFERIKVGNEYKFGAIVQVNKSELRKFLENNGLIRPLASGFN